MQEEWKNLEHLWCSRYAISNWGRIRNEHTGRILRPSFNQQGILKILLTSDQGDGHKISYGIASLVAQEFLGRDQEDKTMITPININGNRADCRVENLVLRPRWFASKYHAQFSRPVLINRPLYESDTDTSFANSREAAIAYGLLEVDIHRSIINRVYVYPTGHLFSFL